MIQLQKLKWLTQAKLSLAPVVILIKRAAISPEMALRIEGWLGVENGGRADLWLGQQATYDLWQVRKTGMPKVQRAGLIAA